MLIINEDNFTKEQESYILGLAEYNQKLSEVVKSFNLNQEQKDLIDKLFDQLLEKKINWKNCLIEIKSKLGLPEDKSLVLATDFFGYGFWSLSEEYSKLGIEWCNSQKIDWKKYQEWSDYLKKPYFRFRDDFEDIFNLINKNKFHFITKQKIAIADILMGAALNIGTPQRSFNNLLQPDLTADANLTQDQAATLLSTFLNQPDLAKFSAKNQLELYLTYAQQLDEFFKTLALDTTDLNSLTQYLTEAIDDEDGVMVVLWWRWIFQNNLLPEFLAKSIFVEEILAYYQSKYPNLQRADLTADIFILLSWRYIFSHKLGFRDPEAALFGQYLVKHGSGLGKIVYYDEQRDQFCWAELKEENGKLVISH